MDARHDSPMISGRPEEDILIYLFLQLGFVLVPSSCSAYNDVKWHGDELLRMKLTNDFYRSQQMTYVRISHCCNCDLEAILAKKKDASRGLSC